MNKFEPDEELTKALLTALDGARKYRKKWEEKRDAKLWAEIDVPLSLADALTHFTKDDLSRIRQNLNLKNISSLKKDDLVARLQEMIPLSMPEVFLQFDQHRYRLIKDMVNNGGCSSAPQLTKKQLNYLMHNGIAFPGTVNGQRVLVMPSENIKVFEKLDDRNYRRRVARNWDIIRLTQGMLYYYGTMGYKRIAGLIKDFGIQPGDTPDFFNLIDHAIAYYGKIRWMESGLSNTRVVNDREIINEHNARSDLDYYPFSREELLRAGEPDFVDRNDSYQRFVNYIIDNYEINREDADRLVEECVNATHAGEPISSIMDFLRKRLEIDSLELLQELTDHNLDLMNNTRQWLLKGYTLAELVPMEQSWFEAMPELAGANKKAEVFSLATRRKIGQNDPCPCGSGLKFKKCCGREQD